MNRTDRLYAIVEELRRAGSTGRSSGWLAKRFEVSSRTIKRDIAALEQANVPIWAAEGRGGGYRLLQNATLPPLTFTTGEAAAIGVALAAEPNLPFRPDGRSALSKVLGAMTEPERAAASRIARRIWMRMPSSAGRPRTAATLDEALRRGVVVNIDYQDAKHRATRGRAVEPLAFARTGGYWYLLAWCRGAKGGRWFRLDRVVRAKLTRELFAERDLLDVFGPPPPDAQPIALEP